MTQMRSVKTLTATALTLTTAAGAFSLAACGSTTSTPAPKAPASHSQPAPAHTTPSQAGLLSQWMAGPGYQDMLKVSTDLSQVATDAGNNDLTAVESDGTALRTDAQAADLNPPPLGATLTATYQQAMLDLVTSGAEMTVGDIPDATTELNTATTLITQIDTALGVTPAAQVKVTTPVPAPAATPAVTNGSAVVLQFYQDITNGDFSGAWALGGDNIGGGDYAGWVAGYNTTASVTVTAVSDYNATTVYATISATQDDGSVRTYAGTYTVSNGVITSADISQTS